MALLSNTYGHTGNMRKLLATPRTKLKIEFRKECWFDPGQGHHCQTPSTVRVSANPPQGATRPTIGDVLPPCGSHSGRFAPQAFLWRSRGLRRLIPGQRPSHIRLSSCCGPVPVSSRPLPRSSHAGTDGGLPEQLRQVSRRHGHPKRFMNVDGDPMPIHERRANRSMVRSIATNRSAGPRDRTTGRTPCASFSASKSD